MAPATVVVLHFVVHGSWFMVHCWFAVASDIINGRHSAPSNPLTHAHRVWGHFPHSGQQGVSFYQSRGLTPSRASNATLPVLSGGMISGPGA